MDEQPNFTSFPRQPLLGLAPPEELFYHVNSQVIDAVQAAAANNAQSLYNAYANIGVALGIDMACIDVVRSYADFRGNASRTLSARRLLFKKDWISLHGMLDGVEVRDKVNHVQQLMRRRRIPEKVIRTLHVPAEEENEAVKIVKEVEKKPVKKSASCQKVASLGRRHIACQIDMSVKRVISCEATDDLLLLDVACQTSAKQFGLRNASCQTKKVAGGKQQKSDDKLAGASGKRVRRRPKLTDSTSNDAQSREAKPAKKDVALQIVMEASPTEEKAITNDGACQTAAEASPIEKASTNDAACQSAGETLPIENENEETLELKVKEEKLEINNNETAEPECLALDEQSATIKSEDKNNSSEFIEWQQPIIITVDDSRKSGSGPLRLKDEIKRSAPYHLPPSNAQHCRAYNTQFTQLTINDLSSHIGATEIYELFREFKSMQCCSVKYDDDGYSLGTATVVFADRAAAIEALNHFDNPTEDGFALNINLAAIESLIN